MATKWKSIISFTAFFLGITLLLSGVIDSVYLLSSRTSWKAQIREAFEEDYQNTGEFRRQMADYLENFLGMATGGPLWGNVYREYYGYYDDYTYNNMEGVYAVESGTGDWSWNFSEEYPNEVAEAIGGYSSDYDEYGGYEYGDLEDSDYSSKEENKKRAERYHNAIKDDKNILYKITYNDGTVYTNAEGTELDGAGMTAPKDYNFLMYFDGNTVKMRKDGKDIDVYKDGYYRDDSDWYVPGYKNFTVDEETQKATVTIAAAKSPKLYIKGDYAKDSSKQLYNRLYWIEYNQRSQKGRFLALAASLALGIVLIAVYLILRKDKKRADRWIARITGKIWYEVKLILLLSALGLVLFHSGYWWDDFFMRIQFGEFYPGIFQELFREMFAWTGGVVGLFWIIYLFVNDHRCNQKVWKQSICGHIAEAFRAADLKLPFQRRVVHRYIPLIAVTGVLILLSGASLLIFCLAGGYEIVPLLVLMILVVLGAVLLVYMQMNYMKKNERLMLDTGILIDQIKTVRDGAITSEIQVQPDSDLAGAVQDLNDIRKGMDTAVKEQIKSERMKVELVSNVSHDIKTPLTSIISYVELLKQEDGLPDYIRDYVQILDSKSQKLKEMVQDVFEVSKAASGQLPVEIEALDLGKLLRQTLADMSERIADSRIQVKTDIPEEEIMIMADGQRLYRVFQNLLQNALQYSLDGSRIYVNLKTDGSVAVASVKNTSASEIPADVNFTERFTRGDSSRTDGGSGLGLSIAKSFTEACGGRMTVETIADLFVVTVEFPQIH
ncbi:sensor histidine kinase [Diplocloster agilis]|uniref:histidine kinase n=1 Tax=Diplocloster agilis TaxID=2850323 RepID=A0A949K213_9FIRM|nr:MULTISPECIES: HAMP domain-containing sensor histidine kinase [Lachnospiraceae]MBU9737877.1 HAMP domain-containing histidine kinase [Diplocloster agilis]MCU6735317.1 HAMP domain-containing histidine kinase [Suonthocola fibrivorans]SCJ70769.1 Alkaline phosphatase synthesis sensor protein phoR [uncultured Clostridium sp.]